MQYLKKNLLLLLLLLLPMTPVSGIEECQIDLIDSEEQGNRLNELIQKEAGFYGTSHFGVYHHIRSASPEEGIVQLDDESIWTIDPFCSRVTLSWLPTDLICFTMNLDPCSEHPYRMINLTLVQSVPCTLSTGPAKNGPLTHWIVAIDSSNRKIYLQDGSYWDMSLFDKDTYRNWEVNDTVIIANNNLKLYLFNPNILINADKMNYARGYCVSLKSP